ncbi:MAG: class I SAM-dependent methyltransferase [Pseudomonadota bacterium]
MFSPTSLGCGCCQTSYRVSGNVPVFAEPETVSDDALGSINFRKRYEWQYQDASSASAYDQSFRASARKRQRTRRELAIVETLLGDQQKTGRLLDIPCGGGRLSDPISDACDELIEADIAPAQLALALKRHDQSGISTRVEGVVASALNIPLANESVDGVICARLSHHLPDSTERRALLAELLRVARFFVIFSFTDLASIQSLSRKLRGKSLNPSAMSQDEIERIVTSEGAHIKQFMTVSNIGPRHRFVLLEKV